MKTLKFFGVFALFFMTVILASCGGKKDSKSSDAVEEDTISYTEDNASSEEASVTDKEEEEEAVESESSSSSSSEDWDAMLDSYDEYVTKYISYMKKAANGDMSALTEYPALMEKAQEYSKKIENAKGEMSSSQLSRYMQITNRMANAALEMQ